MLGTLGALGLGSDVGSGGSGEGQSSAANLTSGPIDASSRSVGGTLTLISNPPVVFPGGKIGRLGEMNPTSETSGMLYLGLAALGIGAVLFAAFKR